MADRRRTYLDACCFIDIVKQEVGALPDDRTEDVWFLQKILQANRDGEIEVFTSVITIAEATHAGGDSGDKVRMHLNRLLLGGQYLRLVQPTPFIATRARDLRWIHGLTLRGADSIHVASALEMDCEEIVSTDGRLARDAVRPKLEELGLKVIRSVDSAVLPAKYRQYDLPEASNGEGSKPH